MYNIKTLNKISPKGLELFNKNYNVSDDSQNPDAILLRSFSMHDMELTESIQAVARAGAGVNNIPIDKCSEKGIVVFNAPGANANAVKELTVAALILSSRDIISGVDWLRTLKGQNKNVPKLVEKEKSQFIGPEISGKKLGVVGLGSIGVMVANAAKALGMDVEGYDPYISIDAAWALSRGVKKASSFEALLQESDYISIHIPLNEQTKNMFGSEQFDLIKKGVRILNMSRNGLINNEDLKKALENGIVAKYVTDFPDEDLIEMKNVITIPHLGASTPESEDNCAIMAASQLIDFLENGNIRNSVNYPACELSKSSEYRITIAHRNVPNMVGQISTILAKEHNNILNMINRSRGELAYTMIDVDKEISKNIFKQLKEVQGVYRIRLI